MIVDYLLIEVGVGKQILTDHLSQIPIQKYSPGNQSCVSYNIQAVHCSKILFILGKEYESNKLYSECNLCEQDLAQSH